MREWVSVCVLGSEGLGEGVNGVSDWYRNNENGC